MGIGEGEKIMPTLLKKTMKFTLTREFYLKPNYVEYKPNIGDYSKDMFSCYVDRDKPVAMFFVGKQSKPKWHYRFVDNFKMQAKIHDAIKSLMSWEEVKAERKEKRSQESKLKTGDILSSSWGYDQTNIDFYQVTNTIGTRTVEIRKLNVTSTDETDFMTAWKMPVKDSFTSGEPMKKLVSDGNTIHLTSYSWATLWDGKPERYSWYA